HVCLILVAVFVADGQESAIRREVVIGKVLIEVVRFTREFEQSLRRTEVEWIELHRNEHQPSRLRGRGVAPIVGCPSDTERCDVSPRSGVAKPSDKPRQQINAQPGKWNASWMSALSATSKLQNISWQSQNTPPSSVEPRATSRIFSPRTATVGACCSRGIAG